MHALAVGLTDVGKVRDHNEDYYLIDENLKTYIVCDGMGGHAAGEVASELAATTTLANLRKHADFLEKFDNSKEACEELTEVVKNSVLDACKEVYQLAQAKKECKGMGTTLTMLMVAGKRGVLAHVGDSRLYLRRENKIYKLSVDHTLMAELLAQGVPMEELQRGRFATANVLTRAVGKDESVKVDILLFDILPNDTFLLCSDGLSSVSNPVELENFLAFNNMNSIPQQLIDLANKRDGSDNITTVVVRIDPEPIHHQEEEQWTTEIQLRFDTLQQIYLFNHVTFRELSKLMSVMQIVECKPGDTIIQEGSTSNQLYILLEGSLEVTRGENPIRKLEAGQHVGEMALLSDQPRSATVRVLNNSRLLFAERDALFGMMREEPSIGVKLLWNLSRGLSARLDETNLQMFGPINVSENNIEDTLRFTPLPPSEEN